jgi:7-cyano-7-deazaguanine synthase
LSKLSLVVFSGGQDSTTCLFWARKRFGGHAVEAVTFDYGQRHRIELDCAIKIAADANVPHSVLPIDTFSVLGGSSLTDSKIGVEVNSGETANLPNTFVPGRNIIFLTFAAALAFKKGIKHLVAGVAQTDYSGYPDCREETIAVLEQTINLGMGTHIQIHTPLMHLSKAETVRLARDVGALEVMADTHTCYRGQRPPCGECPACVLRAKGFEEAGIYDPLVAQVAKASA